MLKSQMTTNKTPGKPKFWGGWLPLPANVHPTPTKGFVSGFTTGYPLADCANDFSPWLITSIIWSEIEDATVVKYG